ncbi:hypothetical protein B0H13DRAFT_1861547 [Mycena leptocephala]|nr:hypothetical protein B0H13DRAFT_1861547 [Mycena leptocephala]
MPNFVKTENPSRRTGFSHFIYFLNTEGMRKRISQRRNAAFSTKRRNGFFPTLPRLCASPAPFATPITIGASETTEELKTWGKALRGKGSEFWGVWTLKNKPKKVLWGEKVITKRLKETVEFVLQSKQRGWSFNRSSLTDTLFDLAPNFFSVKFLVTLCLGALDANPLFQHLERIVQFVIQSE